jgi:hypothetical protein
MAATLSQFLRSLASPRSRKLPGFSGSPIAPNKPFLAIIKRWKHATTNSAEKALFQVRNRSEMHLLVQRLFKTLRKVVLAGWTLANELIFL